MLTVKSFGFDQEKEMNEALACGRLAAGSHVFVSDGKIIFPIEDGEPKSRAQLIIDVKEQKNTIFSQIEIVTHSQRVLERLIKNAKPRVDEAKANLAEAQTKSGREKVGTVRDCENKVKLALGALEQLDAQHNQNAMELARLTLNIELFDERIKELNA